MSCHHYTDIFLSPLMFRWGSTHTHTLRPKCIIIIILSTFSRFCVYTKCTQKSEEMQLIKFHINTNSTSYEWMNANWRRKNNKEDLMLHTGSHSISNSHSWASVRIYVLHRIWVKIGWKLLQLFIISTLMAPAKTLQ